MVERVLFVQQLSSVNGISYLRYASVLMSHRLLYACSLRFKIDNYMFGSG